MKKEYESKYHLLEDSHWWFQARRDIVMRLVQRYFKRKNIRILDVGCSKGSLIQLFQSQGFKNVYGLDKSQQAVSLAAQQGLTRVYKGDALKTNFQTGFFDLIVASDALEHLSDDRLALLEWERILKKQGRLIIFVPAFKFLWSRHDEENKHLRRYSKKQLKEICQKTGFHIEQIGYWNFCSFWLALAAKFTSRGKRNRLNQTLGLTNSLLLLLLKIENSLISHGIKPPLGLSLFSVLGRG